MSWGHFQQGGVRGEEEGDEGGGGMWRREEGEGRGASFFKFVI